MQELLAHAAERLQNARSFALVLGEDADDAAFLAREAVRAALAPRAAFILSFPEPHLGQLQRWAHILPPPSPGEPQKTVLVIPKKDCAIASVSYEEREDELAIIITPRNQPLQKEHVHVRPLLPAPDVLIMFAAQREQVEQRFLPRMIVPPAEQTITIVANATPAAIASFALLKAAFPDLNAPRACSLLLASLLLQTRRFRTMLSQELLDTAAELLRRGADAHAAQLVPFYETREPALIGRALARTTIEAPLGAVWTFLAKSDFERASAAPAATTARALLNDVRLTVPDRRFSVLLWQDADGVRALVAASAQDLALLETPLPLVPFQDMRVSQLFPNFSSCERAVRAALRQLVV